MTAGADDTSRLPGPADAARGLRARVYKAASVAATPPAGYRVLLDGKALRTPARAEFIVPAQALAEAVAAEWNAQGASIDPATLPLTALCNTAIDGIAGREPLIRAEIASYAASDLLCYRADGPEELERLEVARWDPILAWARDALGAELAVAIGVMPVRQSEAATSAIARALEPYDALALSALQRMDAMAGAQVLALAHAHGRLDADEAWTAAHLDEDWQIAKWGEDADASARRARRWAEMDAASRLLALLV
jgi:chaperone required for assembly of F1-ATPase